MDVSEESEPFDLPLTEDERNLLRDGLYEWKGPARVSEEFAIAMRFRDEADLFAEGDRIGRDVTAHVALSALDWARALLATEVVFASDLVGAGRDWATATGRSDRHTIELLREIQSKMPASVFAAARGRRSDV